VIIFVNGSNAIKYAPRNFSDLYATPLGKKLWAFLNERDNLVRMETASYLGRPAVEAVGPLVLDKFGDKAREHRVKQMIGHMTRQILEARGYVVDRQGVRITRRDILFTSGTRYTRR
jgi:hypothetical protein